jgi:hypothetical protein
MCALMSWWRCWGCRCVARVVKLSLLHDLDPSHMWRWGKWPIIQIATKLLLADIHRLACEFGLGNTRWQ